MLARIRTIVAGKDSGASAVEYGLLVAGIAAAIVAVVFLFGGFVSDIFSSTCETIQGQGPVGEGAECSPAGDGEEVGVEE